MSSFNKIVQAIHTQINPSIKITEEKGCIVLRGELDNWADILRAGKMAVSKKYLGVINDIKLKGFVDEMKVSGLTDSKYDGATPDVLIIGGGVVGCAIAREMARLDLDIMLVEKGYDVALMASSRNDGDVHVGIDLHKNTLKHHYNAIGNLMFDKLSEELHVPFERTGHRMFLSENWEKHIVSILKLKAKQLGIKGVRYVPLDELKQMEDCVPDWAIGGVDMPSGGIVSPYKLTVAYAENAAENGVKFAFNTTVTDMVVENDTIVEVVTNRGTIKPKLVINASGTYADVLADMAGDRTFTIHPRKGTILILDKKCGYYSHSAITKAPFARYLDKYLHPHRATADGADNSKGGGISKTVDGNILIGPDAIEIPYREDVSTTPESVDAVLAKHSSVIPNIKRGDVITYFAGVRAATYEEDFVVRKGISTHNIIEAAGIQSPGLTSAPAIALDVVKWTKEMLNAKDKANYNPVRQCVVPCLSKMTDDEKDKLIKSNPSYGEIVCRCEQVSKGEIVDVLHSPLPVYTVDAIKRRIRPGMGRCQGGFCGPLVVGIIADVLGVDATEVKKAGEASVILYNDTKKAIGGKRHE